jgi:glycosyltransferase involved in cell wall biosynthesis
VRLLLSAYACEPNTGSEPGAGWNWARQAARFHEVWVVTRSNNRQAIERELAANPNPNMHFVYHDLPGWARGWKRGSRGFYLYYLLWQLTAIRRARALSASVTFELAHHLTIGTMRFPSFLAAVGIPYIWGPVGGGERPPTSLYPTHGPAGALRQVLRDASNRWARIDPLVGLTATRARVILTTTDGTTDALPAKVRAKARVVPQIGTEVPDMCVTRAHGTRGALRLVFIARLTYWKGLHLALPGMARAVARGMDVTLSIRGEGSERARLARLVDRLGLSARVEFIGRLPTLDQVSRLLDEHDALLFPSLQDSGGMVVLEAMAAGLPVICFDVGGPSVSVTEETGVRVALGSREQITEDMASAMVRLAEDPSLRQALGRAGQERVRTNYSWDRKGDVLRELYAELSASLAERTVDPKARNQTV